MPRVAWGSGYNLQRWQEAVKVYFSTANSLSKNRDQSRIQYGSHI